MNGSKVRKEKMLLVPCPYLLDIDLFHARPAQHPTPGMCDSLPLSGCQNLFCLSTRETEVPGNQCSATAGLSQ